MPPSTKTAGSNEEWREEKSLAVRGACNQNCYGVGCCHLGHVGSKGMGVSLGARLMGMETQRWKQETEREHKVWMEQN